MNPVERLVQQLQLATTLNPGATAAELDVLRNLFGDLPDDVRTFYSLANGMPDLTYDENRWVSFWSIEKMQTEPARWGDNEIGFADFLIDSWRFIFRPTSHGLVVATENVWEGRPLEEIGSFSKFADMYVRHPNELCIF